MATLSSLRPLLALICCFSLLSATMAQEVQDASDLRATDNAPDTGNDFDLVFNIPVAEKTYKIAPLSDASSTLKTDLTGNLRVINPGNVNSLPDNTIAYISCDDDDSVYPGQIRAKETFNLAIHHSPPPISVLLYSINNKSCTLVPNNLRAPSIYSMQDKAWSDETLKQLQSNTTMMLNATISPDSSDGSGGGGILGKSPTTAVAMIILYSITGLITALFLIIIIVGAVRAHRHPERYGPRNVIGRPRQSRAKGIGRAILETFPLVKFGDHDNIKPGDQPRDIEMMPPQTTPQTSLQGQAQGAAASASDRRTTQEDTDAVTAEQVAGQETRPQPSGDPIENADNGLACSVCTDDFAKGQDVRVLPCNHKFHPDCIDPWLLNVSGTCPLCRVDLRPTTTEEEGPANENGEQAPPRRHSDALTSFAGTSQANQSRRSSRSRPLHYLHHYLNRGRMEEATPEERLEALRNLRLINISDTDPVPRHLRDDDNWNLHPPGTRSRLSARFSRAFGGDRSRPVSWAPPPGTPTPAVQESRNEDARVGEPGASANATTRS